MAEEGSTAAVRFYHEQRNVLLEQADVQVQSAAGLIQLISVGDRHVLEAIKGPLLQLQQLFH